MTTFERIDGTPAGGNVHGASGQSRPTRLQLWIDPEMAAEIRAAAVRLNRLSESEREIVTLLGRGLTNKQTGYKLSVSTRTIENRRAAIMKKLELVTPAELFRLLTLSSLEGNGEVSSR